MPPHARTEPAAADAGQTGRTSAANPPAGSVEQEIRQVVPVPVQAMLPPMYSSSATRQPPAAGQAAAGAGPAAAEGGEAAGPARPSFLDAALGPLEIVLRVLNAPFCWLGESARMLLGWTAVATLLVTLVAGRLLPQILAPTDFVTEFRARYAVAPAPEAAAPKEAANAHGPEAKGQEKSGGHGKPAAEGAKAGSHGGKPAGGGH